MKCGFYELDITPPLGSIIPGDFAARHAQEILDPLFARAAVLCNDNMALAIVSIDACGITADIAEMIRTRVCSRIPMKPEQIMAMATHAHGGGPTLNWGEEVVREEGYIRLLADKAADAIVTAYENAKETELLAGKEMLHGVSFIRVYHMKDGSLKTNPGAANRDKIDKPTTTIDPEVLVLAARQGDSYAGAIVNFANHPATVATNQITGDYISALSAKLKSIYGSHFVTVFVNGACGNINHINPYDPLTRVLRREWTVGIRLAEKVAAAIENAAPMTDETLRSKCGSISVKLRKPTAEQLLDAKKVFDSLGDRLADSVPGTPDYITTFFALQAFIIQADKRTRRQIDL